jgi:assimilatory nitrate reductase catalytic subunit
MLHLMLWEDLVDRSFIEAHTTASPLEGAGTRFHAARRRRALRHPRGDLVTPRAGLRGADAVALLSGTQPVVGGHGKERGADQSPSRNRQIGKLGAGPFSLTGQPNAMGGREVGGIANLLSAHRDLADPVHRAEVAALWGVREVPARPG